MAKNRKHVIAITLGDINGVGPEIVIKALSDSRMLNQVTPVIFGSSKTISYYRKLLKIDDFSVFHLKEGQEPNYKRINLVECWDEIAEINLGEAKKDAGKKALKALDKACEFLEKGYVDAVVTSPINKATAQSDEFSFPGHTEYLGARYDGNPLMFMVADSLRIAVATGHVPIHEVPALITQERIEKSLKKLIKSLKIDFGISKPKVAVLGLNPHAGEEGLLGKEEIEVIKPTIIQFKDKGELVFGPIPADGFFGSGAYKKYDAILAMYHDQGLIPFKSLSFGKGINFTAGLSIVRTSPDHGTGYDIAGQGLASETSLRSAIYLAADILKNRDEIEPDIE
jgi:4-hydroxythreonine-4-phosphate dehydrogenase